YASRLHLVTRLLVYSSDLQTEALHDRAKVVRTRDCPVGIAQVRASDRIGVADLVVDFAGEADLEWAVAVNDVGADDVGMVDVLRRATAARAARRVRRTRIVHRRVLDRGGEAHHVRRVIPNAVGDARVETAVVFAQVAER